MSPMKEMALRRLEALFPELAAKCRTGRGSGFSPLMVLGMSNFWGPPPLDEAKRGWAPSHRQSQFRLAVHEHGCFVQGFDLRGSILRWDELEAKALESANKAWVDFHTRV